MHGADQGLLLADDVAIGAVVQADGQVSLPTGFAGRLEPHRGQGVAEARFGGSFPAAVSGKSQSDFVTLPFDLLRIDRTATDHVGQPAAELRVCGRPDSSGRCRGVDCPEIPGAAPAVPLSLPDQETRFSHLLQVDSDAVRVPIEGPSQLVGRGRPAKIAENLEQASSGRLGEGVVVFRDVHLRKVWQATRPGPDPRCYFTHGICENEGTNMTYVINEPCIGEKDASCTEVCPVDCIHPAPAEPGFEECDQLYIDPDECIDCDACVEACPVDAITAEDAVPAEWFDYIAKNANYFKNGK